MNELRSLRACAPPPTRSLPDLQTDARPLLPVGVQIMDESMLEWFLRIPFRELVEEVFGHDER